MSLLERFSLPLFYATEKENRRVILGLLERDESAKVLDCGCSSGELTLELQQRIGTAELYGIELRSEKIKSAEEKGIKVYRADLNEELPFEKETFDVIHANQVIEHLDKVVTFVKELYRILKPGGHAVVSTPNLASLHNITWLILGLSPPTINWERMVSDEGPTIHRKVFTRGSLQRLFRAQGFKVEKMIGVGYYPFPSKISRLFSHIDHRHAVYITIKVRKE